MKKIERSGSLLNSSFPKVVAFYEKAFIPIISERKACDRKIQLRDDNAKIGAIPCKRLSTAASLAKVKHMEDTLAKTLPLWPVNADQLVKNSEDAEFLRSMNGDRSACFGSASFGSAKTER